MLAELERNAEQLKRGVVDRFAKHRKTSLEQNINDFESYLRSKGGNRNYVVDTVRYVRSLCASCKFRFLPDITADRVAKAINDLSERPIEAKRKSTSSCHRDEELDQPRYRSARTTNAYLVAMKGFCRWCVRDYRLSEDPIAHLAKRNEKADPRLQRRTLQPHDLAGLIEAAERSEQVFRGLSGVDRAMLYMMAVATGFRASELASLTESSIFLESDPPYVVVEAAYSKRKRRDEQPIPHWLANRIESWQRESPSRSRLRIHEKLSTSSHKLWPGSWKRRAAEM